MRQFNRIIESICLLSVECLHLKLLLFLMFNSSLISFRTRCGRQPFTHIYNVNSRVFIENIDCVHCSLSLAGSASFTCGYGLHID